MQPAIQISEATSSGKYSLMKQRAFIHSSDSKSHDHLPCKVLMITFLAGIYLSKHKTNLFLFTRSFFWVLRIFFPTTLRNMLERELFRTLYP